VYACIVFSTAFLTPISLSRIFKKLATAFVVHEPLEIILLSLSLIPSKDISCESLNVEVKITFLTPKFKYFFKISFSLKTPVASITISTSFQFNFSISFS